MNWPFAKGVKVIKRHESGLVAIDKPDGILSHPNKTKNNRAVLTCNYDKNCSCYSWFDDNNNHKKLFLLNRIDSATSGLILATTNDELVKPIKELFFKQEVNKKYIAIVKGNASNSKKIWKDSVRVENKQGKLRAIIGAGKTALTHVDQIQYSNSVLNCSKLELLLKTGITHQLRIQCASRHIPIIGDELYGDFKFNKLIREKYNIKRLMLHSSEISLKFQFNNKNIKFSAVSNLPEDFDKII